MCRISLLVELLYSGNEPEITCDHELEVVREGAMHLEQAGWDVEWNLRIDILKDLITLVVIGFLLDCGEYTTVRVPVVVARISHTVWTGIIVKMTVLDNRAIIHT